MGQGWLRSGGISLAELEAFVSDLGLVCESYWVQPLGSAGVELSMTLEQVTLAPRSTRPRHTLPRHTLPRHTPPVPARRPRGLYIRA